MTALGTVTVLNSSILFLFLFANAGMGASAGLSAEETTAEAPETDSLEGDLWSAIRSARGSDVADSGPFVIQAEEGQRLRVLFERTLQATWKQDQEPEPPHFSELIEVWEAEGFDFGRLQEGVWLLRESQGQKRGRGIYAFRSARSQNAGSPSHLLAAPHALPSDDQRTGKIVAGMFSKFDVHVAAWSTVSRREIDWTHSEETPFQQLTETYVSVVPAGSVVQIHGFAQSKRKTERGRGASIILSNGTDDPDPGLERRAKCAEQGFSPVYVYPEVRELGATKNTQGIAMRKSGQGRFRHVELSFDVRQRIVTEAEPFDELARCILEAPSW